MSAYEQEIFEMKMPLFYTQLDKKNQYIMKCCYFVFAVNGLFAIILGSLIPLISSEYGLNNTATGTLLSAHQAGTLISGFVSGILPFYLGRKKSIIFLCSFAAMGFFIMMITGNPLLLFLAFLFTGLSRGSISNFNNTVVNEVSNSSPVALNFVHSIFAIGALCSPFLVILCTSIAGDTGWKIAAGIIIILVIISIYFLSKIKMDDAVKKKDNISYRFLKYKEFWVITGIFFFYLCVESAVNGWIVKYFVDSDIMTREFAQMLASLLWGAILLGRLTCAFIGDKVPKKSLLLMISSGTTVSYLLLMSTQNINIITIAIIGLGFSMAGIFPISVAFLGNTIKSYPMSMGLLLMIGNIGSIIMPIIIGAVADRFGIFAGMSVIIFAIVMMMVFVFIKVFGRKQETLQHK